MFIFFGSWHVTCVTHPLFFSASQMCTYAMLAYERVKERPEQYFIIGYKINQALNYNKARLNIGSLNWIAKVKHPALLDILKFKKPGVQIDEKGKEESVNEESDVPAVGKVEAGVAVGKVEGGAEAGVEVGKDVKGEEEVNYRDVPLSYLGFYRNVVVHTKRVRALNIFIVYFIILFI